MLTIIGCGNTNRCDDGVGVYVARQLAETLSIRPNDAVRVLDGGTGGMEVMFQARGSGELVIVDACRSGSEPGAVFKVPGDEFQSSYEPVFTLHDFRWEHALAAGRKIFRDTFPQHVTVYLIEAQRLDFGLELSDVVKRAAAGVITDLAAKIDRYDRR